MKRSLEILFLFLLLFGSGFMPHIVKAEAKIKIESVDFHNNNAFPDRTLRKIMLNKPASLFQPVYYDEQLLQVDLSQIEKYYRQHGYLDARITGHTVEIDSSDEDAYIDITLYEGELTRVEGIEIFGNSVYSDSLLKKKAVLKQDDPLEQEKIDQSAKNITNYYADNGYIEVEVSPDVNANKETGGAIVDFHVTEGERFTIGEISINGLDKTKKHVAAREMTFESGEIIDNSALLQTQLNLYRTGLFQSVFIRRKTSDKKGVKDVSIDLTEKEYREFSISVGYGSVERFRVQSEISHQNAFGSGRKAGLRGKLSFKYRNVELNFSDPRLLDSHWKGDISLSAGFEDEPGYDIFRRSFRTTLGRPIVENGKIIFTSRIENNELENIELTHDPDQESDRIRSFSGSFVWDRRNNAFNASSGAFFEIKSELAGIVIKTENNYIKSMIKYKKFKSFDYDLTLGTAIEIGWIYSSQQGVSAIPLGERFYTGGPNSIRGFEYRKAGPLDQNRVPIGGKFKIVFNAFELRKKVYKYLNLAIFTDVGNVWSEPDYFDLKSFRISPGIGVRIDAPIGLGRIDYGFNPFRETAEEPGMFYLSVGQAF